jgi:quercetin dioxygenase-like cupin family protein
MRRNIRLSGRFGVFAGLALIGWIGGTTAAQQPPARPAGAVQSNFTGTVKSLDAADIRAVRFEYDAGARSYWHVHDGSQILLLEKGRGRMQIQGQRMQELVPGQPVVLAGGVAHWHGAAPDQGLTQIAVNVGGVKWMNAVTDQEYQGK